MRFAAILLTVAAISAPAFAQTGDTQDHSAHHPPDVGGTSPNPSADGTQKPALSDQAAGSATGMGCPMMPEMMQSMMKGMMQGMMNSGQAMAAGGMAGMAPGGVPAQGRTSTPAAADQSLPAITLRALAERTRNSLSSAGQGGDAEFVRVAIVLQEALLDSAKALAAFGNSPEIRQKAQTLLAANEAQLALLKGWAASLK